MKGKNKIQALDDEEKGEVLFFLLCMCILQDEEFSKKTLQFFVRLTINRNLKYC
jgi:hypothetical protein